MRFGADLNAYTSFDETVYILPVPTDQARLLDKGFDILEDWASGVLFDSTDVVAERGVVLEEWRRGLGAEARIRDKQFPVFFQGLSRYADRLPIGLPDVIQSATPAPLKRFYHDWYRPNLMALVAVGDVDPVQVERMIRDRFGKMTNPVRPRPRATFGVPPSESTLVTIATDKEQDVTTVLTLYKHPPRRLVSRADYRQLLLGRLYNNMLNDRFSEIGRRPNAPFSFASSSYGALVRTADAYELAALVKDGSAQRRPSGPARGSAARGRARVSSPRNSVAPRPRCCAASKWVRRARQDRIESIRVGACLALPKREPAPGIAYGFSRSRRCCRP
ncbi:MAG: insulinase family protein [Gemmatimonadaceae bacterium]